MFFSMVRGRMFVCVFEPFHPPHVNRGDGHSGSNPNPGDSSSDVEVVETGGSPYQQPASNLGGDRATMITNFCLAKNAWHKIVVKSMMSSHQGNAVNADGCASAKPVYKAHTLFSRSRLTVL